MANSGSSATISTPDDYGIGLRVLDIEHGFRETRPDPVIQSELANSLLLGKALNLALHLRGFNVIGGADVKGLRYAAAELGIASTELQTVLRELQELDWVRLKESGSQIKRVEVIVPALRSGFEVIGGRWRDLSPTEIEQASVRTLADTIIMPLDESSLVSGMGMSREVANAVLDIGEAGTYLRRHRMDDGQKLVYSPLYGDANPEKAHELVKRHGDERVRDLIRRVQGRQGVPVEGLADTQLTREAILSGVVLAPAVRDKQFVFTPQRGVAQDETVILDKARAIVACVRYGQEYAEITKISFPRAIVDALINRGTLKPHSEHLEQYGLLVRKGIGRVDKVGTRWQFTIHDTDDNKKALLVARDLLDTGDAVHQQIDEEVQARILNPDARYSTPVAQRVKLHQTVKTKSSDVQTARAISELIRGATSV